MKKNEIINALCNYIEIYIYKSKKQKNMSFFSKNIKVKLENGMWMPARNYQKNAFITFDRHCNVNMRNDYVKYDDNISGIHFTIKNDKKNMKYLITESGLKMPVVDWNNVKVCHFENGIVEWKDAKNYETWAYFNFIYGKKNEQYYCSKKSKNLDPNINYIEIPIDNIEKNIVFQMSKNDENITFCDDKKISDNNSTRKSISESYHISNKTRKFDILGLNDILKLKTEYTPDIYNKCIICKKNKQNLRYQCGHTQICSECTIESIKLAEKNKLYPKCFACGEIIKKILPYTVNENKHYTCWFEKTFGFSEKRNFQTNKETFEKLYDENNQRDLNGIEIGEFMLRDLRSLNGMKNWYDHVGDVNIENIIGNIKDIHTNHVISDLSTIQVASQFNCLEMANPNLTPENGITIYENDHTQGPTCAMATPAGLAYRNYLYNNKGQTKTDQIDMTSQLLSYLKLFDNSVSWIMENGYMMFNDVEQLKKINRILMSDSKIRNNARSLIQVGSHTNLGICIDGNKYHHHVNHVYCSGLPINYNDNISKDEKYLWDGLSELFLEAAYDNTLLLSVLYNPHERTPCYLTRIGGGVFGMKDEQIMRAIVRACKNIAQNGFNLEVKIVHHGYISNKYNVLQNKNYKNDLTNFSLKSVWDDDEWRSKSM